MKPILFFLFFITVNVCALKAQSLNQEITEENKNPFLLGEINKEGLLSQNYAEWFLKNYAAYEVDIETINQLKTTLADVTITVFLGTWCGDSKREVPKFYKVIDEIGFPEKQIQIFALSAKEEMYKQSPNKNEKGLNIHRVPTFIISKNGEELNRIIEFPVESFEKDLLKISTNQYYEPNYLIVEKVAYFIEKEGLQTFTKLQPTLASILKPISKKNAELSALSRVLNANNKTHEAIEVLKFNSLLFPNEFSNYEELGYYYYKNNDKSQALENYQKAVELNPKNETLKNTLEKIQKEINSKDNPNH